MRAPRLRLDTLAVVLPLLVSVVACQAVAPEATSPRDAAPGPADVEWRTYGGTYASARYSPLAQIDRDNVQQLRVAWRWRSPDHDVMARVSSIETYANEATPLMVGGVLYVSTSLSQVAAIDAATGQTLWTHDPEVWKLGTPPIGTRGRIRSHRGAGQRGRALARRPQRLGRQRCRGGQTAEREPPGGRRHPTCHHPDRDQRDHGHPEPPEVGN